MFVFFEIILVLEKKTKKTIINKKKLILHHLILFDFEVLCFFFKITDQIFFNIILNL